MGTPKPKQRDQVIDVEEAADVAVPIDSDAARDVRRRMATSRERVDRGALQIPKMFSNFISGIKIPK